MKEINHIIKYAKKLNFKIEQTKKCHFRFTGYGQSIITASTTGDRRSILKVKKCLLKISEGRYITNN